MPTLFIVLCLVMCTFGYELVIQNAQTCLKFDVTTLHPVFLGNSACDKNPRNLILPSNETLWFADFIGVTTPGQLIARNSRSECRSRRGDIDQNWTRLTLQWIDVKVAFYFVSVKLVTQLVVNSLGKTEVHFNLSFDGRSSAGNVGLWSYRFTPFLFNLGANSNTASEADSTVTIIQNHGFGVAHPCSPSRGDCPSFSSIYPSANTFQFLAFYTGASKNGRPHAHASEVANGVYFATHDPIGDTKTFLCDTDSAALKFSVSMQPSGAGRSFQRDVAVSYPIVVSLFSGDWWDASQLYRAWALPNALWAKRGLVRQRADTPAWLFNTTTWVNSHWQQNDIFNTSGGDPIVVRNRVTSIARRFNLTRASGAGLGLHWYEWDLLGYEYGSNYTKCTSEVTCGFDTHYPDYFPVRENFEKSLRELRAMGIRVAPYINGRIFDKGTKRWAQDDAVRYMAKNVSLALNSDQLSIYDEQYGSLAEFAVACPATKYWYPNEVISNTVGRLVTQYGVDGVYIDQIAIATPKPCWDPTHNHADGGGGGNYWTQGYRAMLQNVRSQVGASCVLTEGCAESYMDGINVYLALNAYEVPEDSAIVPIFQAVYGGYYFAMGSEFFAHDFLHGDGDIFAAKITQQYMLGSQLGWFSLGGRTNQHPYMGLYELLMDRRFDDEIAYLRVLHQAKLVGNPFLQEGRAMRNLDLTVGDGSAKSHARKSISHPPRPLNSRYQDDHATHLHGHSHSHSAKPTTQFGYDPIMSAVWSQQNISADSFQLFITIARNEKKGPVVNQPIQFILNVADYGFPLDSRYASPRFVLRQVFPFAKNIDEFQGCCISYNTSLRPRQVFSFIIERTDI